MKIAGSLLISLLLLIPSCSRMSEETPEAGLIPKINQFEATPSLINEGDVTYLRWSVSNADSVSIDNGIGNVALAGEIPVSPDRITFYTLTGTNFARESSARTLIMVKCDT